VCVSGGVGVGDGVGCGGWVFGVWGGGWGCGFVGLGGGGGATISKGNQMPFPPPSLPKRSMTVCEAVPYKQFLVWL